jgi:XTP/dITP diphosphohydrolase
VEIQSEDLASIARNSLTQVLEKHHLPVMVEDAGLFIQSLRGFPGPYSSYVYRTLGVEGVLRLMKGQNRRKAYFLSVIAYGSPKAKPQLFTGKVEGLIVEESRGKGGFGFDPLFQPHGCSQTFAEMSLAVKNQFSHRAQAFRKLACWLAKAKFL